MSRTLKTFQRHQIVDLIEEDRRKKPVALATQFDIEEPRSKLRGIFDRISDDAGQFKVFLHGLCWVHAERGIQKIVGFNDHQNQLLEKARADIWQFYRDLKKYRCDPSEAQKQELEDRFNNIFTEKTGFATLDIALKRIYRNKSELLLVLSRPDVPLHNNLSERDIREYVKKRKISGATRSETGKKCRDTFTSLKKTCRKLGISFWQYLKDRIEYQNKYPPLAEIMESQMVQSVG